MTDIYEGYLSPEERKAAIADAKLDALFERCHMMYEMVQLQYEQNVREAELKVLTEGGTYDDLAYLIEEAGEEAADKKKGLISTLIDGIISLFKQIGESIRKLFVKDGVEVEADEGIMSGVNTFDKMFGVVERTFSGGIVQAFLKGVGVVEGLKQAWNLFTSIPKASGKMRKYASDGVNKAKEILAKICDWIAEKTKADKSKVNEMTPEQLDEDKGEGWSIRKVLDWFKEIGKSINEHINSLATSLGEKLRDDGSNDENGDNQKPSDPKTIMSTIQKDAALSKNGWYKNGDKYDKDSSKIIDSAAKYLDSERYKEILTNSGVKDVDNKDGDRKQYDDYVNKKFGKWSAKDPNKGLRGNDNTQQPNNANPTDNNQTPNQSNPQQQTQGTTSQQGTSATANNSQGQAQGTHESALDDYIDDLESTIYENSMSDYEYHSLVSAIDALF